MNRPLRNRTTGGVGGRREYSRLLPDSGVMLVGRFPQELSKDLGNPINHG
jgi:hypothetical protein